MCNKLVDKEAQEFVKHSTKHYHKHCFEQFELGKQQRKELHEYICELYNMPQVNGFILKQIKDYEENYGYKLTGIRAALYWFHQIEGNPTESTNTKYKTQGIGIVAYIYQDAKEYFTRMHNIAESAKGEKVSNTSEVVYLSPKQKKKNRNYVDIKGIANE